MNHGSHDPTQLNKALKRTQAPVAARARRATGLLATPPDAPSLDLSGF